MHWLNAFILAGCASLSAAHADTEHAGPRLLGGRRFLSELKGKRIWEETQQAAHMVYPERTGADELEGTQQQEKGGILHERQSRGRCGRTRGSCAQGYCCSAEGYCGLGFDYCGAPDCQLAYGPACDGNQKPTGVDTSRVERRRVGNVMYGGAGVYDCVNSGDIALTFDDGPWNYTNDLLDKLAKYEAKATFFITGTNLGKGQINDPDLPWRDVIQRMADEGHQIASHTWSHQNFSAITAAQARNQMLWNEIAFNDILGYFPTYMRPPYSICPASCQTLLVELGYHAIYFDLDTEGYLHDAASEIQTSKDLWDDAVDGSSPCEDSYLQIEHDIHYQTVYNLTDYVLASLFAHGYRSVTVGQCLGDPPENWYRAGSGVVPGYDFSTRAPTGTFPCLPPAPSTVTSTSAAPTTTTSTVAPPGGTLEVSPDGACGMEGITCKGSEYGNCCSANGWCGASVDYCGNGCRSDSGDCSAPDGTVPRDDPITTALPTGPGVPDSPLTTTTTSSTRVPDTPLTTTTATTSAPVPTLEVSVEGNCGGGVTCEGSQFGNCCSQHGWCGTTEDYCGEGCQSSFGSGCQSNGTTTTTTTTASSSTSTTPRTTSTPSSTSTSTSKSSSSSSKPTNTTPKTTPKPPTPTPTPPLVPSRNGACGPGTGQTCRGSDYGICCSRSTRECGLLCILGDCLPQYGVCLL